MTKTLLTGGAIALSVLGALVLSPDKRSPDLENYALYRRLPPLGMITPRKRYAPPYNLKQRGSGRRKMIRGLG